jgi:hypothetical protein
MGLDVPEAFEGTATGEAGARLIAAEDLGSRVHGLSVLAGRLVLPRQ